MLLGLGSNVSVYFKGMSSYVSTVRATRKIFKGGTATIKLGLTNGMFYIGRVQKMRMKVGTSGAFAGSQST